MEFTNINWLPVTQKYKLLKKIGRGAYGVVIEAEHIESGKNVAIKMVDVNNQCKYSFKKVLRELSILRQLSDMALNVFTTKLYDVIVSEEGLENIDSLTHVFLVLERVDYDIKTLFKNGMGGFTDTHANVVMYNLLCAMKFLHSTGLIHRDIKPANILIDSNCTVKICDFGLSTVEDSPVKVKKVKSVCDLRENKTSDNKSKRTERKHSP